MSEWKNASYNMQKSGDCAVTRHPISAGGYFYIAWHEQTPLSEHDTADAAKQACADFLAVATTMGVKK